MSITRNPEAKSALSPRVRRCLYLTGAVAVGLLVLQSLSAGASDHHVARARPDHPPSYAVPSTVETTAASAPRSSSYAIPLPELKGLPADARPGTELEVWVAWTKPITKGPRIQRLVSGVTLQRILPPVTRAEPATAMLSVPRDQIARLLYGDRFGALSATAASTPSTSSP